MLSLKPKHELRSKGKLRSSAKVLTGIFIILSFFTLAFNIAGKFSASGIVAEFLFKENTGTVTADGSGNSHTGTLANGPTWVAGKFGQAVNFDGTNDYINIPDHNDFTLDPALSYTWSGWVKNNSFKEWSTIWSQTLNSANYFYFYAHSTTDPEGGPVTNGISVYWWVNNGASRITVHSNNNVLTAGQWSYVAVTYNGTLAQNNRFTIYVNGTDVTARGDVASAGTITTINPTNIRIGSNEAFGEYLNGAVDEFRYYRRLLSQAEIVSDMNTNTGTSTDTELPVVSITAPASAATVSGTVNVTATATDNVGVAGVQFLLDGVALGAEDVATPFAVSWNTTTATQGNHILTAKARDAAGNSKISTAITVTVNNPDIQAPTVTVSSPAAGSTLSGTVSLAATATDNIGVAGVKLLVDGTLVGAEDVTAPYSVSLNTTTLSNGAHIITAVARDAAANTTTSAPVSITINNDIESPSITISAPAAGTVLGTVNVTADANDNVGVSGVQFLLDGVALGAEDVSSPFAVAWNTTTATQGNHLLTAKARDAAGNSKISAAITVTVNNPDIQAPAITVTSPAAGSTLSGTVSLTATATDNIGVAGVQFLIDGTATGPEVLTSPYTLQINSTSYTNGNHLITARARDAAGNVTVSTAVTAAVQNTIPDTEVPVVAVSSPVSDASVTGTINLSATATDNIGVVGVKFLIDGTLTGAEDLTAPYSVSLNTATLSNGAHSITAVARDAAANTSTSTPVTITVDNDLELPTVAISAPAAGTVSGTVNITAEASDNVGVAGVQFLLDGNVLGAEVTVAPYSIAWNTTGVTNGNHILSARARDAAGNLFTSAGVTVTVTNADTGLPAVAMTAPATGTVVGTINITANATDNVGVVGVQFLLDGASIGAEDLTAPYAISWNSTTTTNGAHSLSAKARDAAGNTMVSTAVNVTVNNDLELPTTTITAPAPGAVVAGTVTVSASATDNVGVAGVQFLVNGVSIGAEDVTAPYSISWNTTTFTNGNYVLVSKARDAAGNIAVSQPSTVTVTNSNGLISAHPFNEGTGTAAADISGNSHGGTLTNGPTWGAGKYGQAINFDGTNDYVNILDHNDYSLDPAVSYTWSAWVKNNSFKEWSTVWSQTLNTSNFFYFYAHTSTDPDGGPVTNGISVYWWVNNGASRLGAHSSNNVLTAGQWSHVTVTYNAAQPQNNRFSIYVNGVDVTVRTDVSSVGTITAINPTNIRVGSNQAFGEYLNGSVDEVRYYKRLLTAAEIVTDMNTPLGADNVAPTVTLTVPAANATVSATATLTATAADNTGVTGVQFLLDGAALGAEDISAPYSISWNTTTVTNGSHLLTARARDASGNVATSAAVTVTVSNIPDTEAPAVAITAPAPGEVLGATTITATATDNIGVSGVQFLINGVNFGAEDVNAPYSIAWSTINLPNGSYTLTANARDAAGNISNSAAVVVNVNNPPDTQSPSITISSPAGGNISGTTTISANVSDNIGVTGVQFLLDGASFGSEITAPPYSIQWNTSSGALGGHTISATARDLAGNTSTAPVINVTVVISNPPVISGIGASSVTAGTAIIKWTTNSTSTSQVNYGTTTSYNLFTLVDSTLVTAHSMSLVGLSPGTLYHYQVLSADIGGALTSSADLTFTTPALPASIGNLNEHTVLADATGKIVPWTANPALGYDSVMKLAWNYLLNAVPNDPQTGKPVYYSRSLINPNTQLVVDWPHNPAGLYGMLIESALKFYQYSGNIKVMQLAENVALWHLDHGMTLATDSWASVPYASGDGGSLTYGGAAMGNSNGQGDGVGYLQPDKIGELAFGWLQLYKYDGNTRFRDAAIQSANVLSSKIRAGSTSQSPWPFRVNAKTGVVREDYCSNLIGTISLFDGLIAAGLGNTAAYQTARTAAWTWLMNFPMQNNAWAQYFEDVSVQDPYNSNLNQYNAMMTARYLLEHPESDANWEAHVRGLITWVESLFTQAAFGATTIKEQTPVFPYPMGSHTSRYASVNALLYEKTGDVAAKEKAYRSFNWATYMTRANGVVLDGPEVGTEWFTDGYGDYIRHFMTGIAAVPEWSPVNQTHLLRSTSVVKTVTYGTNSVNYTTFDAGATEVLHISFNPVNVTADGIPLPKRTDLTQPGWTLDVATKTMKIYHTAGTQIGINSTSPARRMNTSDPMYTYLHQGKANPFRSDFLESVTRDTKWLGSK